MNQSTTKILFALLRSVICGDQLSEQDGALITADVIRELLAVVRRHDIEHLLVEGLRQNGFITDDDELLNLAMNAVYRYVQINYDLSQACEKLETAAIPFVPLKGSVIRRYYPEPWMRTSCDIDILVHEEEVEKVASYLVDTCGCTYEGKGSHDIALNTSNENRIELHYDLIEDGRANLSNTILNTVWNHVSVREGYDSLYEMSDEMFYFYHIAHMAKHFEFGGCGIRTFIDLWILDQIEDVDTQKRDELLRQGDLLKFAEAARRLSKVWFDSVEHDALTEQMESYILHGGVYGTTKNRVIVQQQKQGGRLKYLLSRVFISYELLKFRYPILQKHRWLTPIMEVRRWFGLVFGGRAKHSMRELEYNNSISSEEAKEMQEFLREIGL